MRTKWMFDINLRFFVLSLHRNSSACGIAMTISIFWFGSCFEHSHNNKMLIKTRDSNEFNNAIHIKINITECEQRERKQVLCVCVCRRMKSSSVYSVFFNGFILLDDDDRITYILSNVYLIHLNCSAQIKSKLDINLYM